MRWGSVRKRSRRTGFTRRSWRGGRGMYIAKPCGPDEPAAAEVVFPPCSEHVARRNSGAGRGAAATAEGPARRPPRPPADLLKSPKGFLWQSELLAQGSRVREVRSPP